MTPTRKYLSIAGVCTASIAIFASAAYAQGPRGTGITFTQAAPLHTIKKARNETSIAGSSGSASVKSEWTYKAPDGDTTASLDGEAGRLTTLAFFETASPGDKPLEVRALYILPFAKDGQAALVWFFGFFDAHWSKAAAPGVGHSWEALRLGSGTTRSFEAIGVAPDQAITGLRVCVNKKGDKIKGAEIFGARFNNSGAPVQDNSIKDKFERPNCKTWSPVVRCSAGQVAVGVRGYTKDQNKGFSGMSLICAPYTTNRNGLAVDAQITYPDRTGVDAVPE